METDHNPARVGAWPSHSTLNPQCLAQVGAGKLFRCMKDRQTDIKETNKEEETRERKRERMAERW